MVGSKEFDEQLLLGQIAIARAQSRRCRSGGQDQHHRLGHGAHGADQRRHRLVLGVHRHRLGQLPEADHDVHRTRRSCTTPSRPLTRRTASPGGHPLRPTTPTPSPSTVRPRRRYRVKTLSDYAALAKSGPGGRLDLHRPGVQQPRRRLPRPAEDLRLHAACKPEPRVERRRDLPDRRPGGTCNFGEVAPPTAASPPSTDRAGGRQALLPDLQPGITIRASSPPSTRPRRDLHPDRRAHSTTRRCSR